MQVSNILYTNVQHSFHGCHSLEHCEYYYTDHKILYCNIDDVICVMYSTVSLWLTLRAASPVRVNMAAMEFLDKLILLLLPQYMAVEPILRFIEAHQTTKTVNEACRKYTVEAYT